MTYTQLLEWIKGAGFEQWSWVAGISVVVVSGLRWLFRAKSHAFPTVQLQTSNSARGASSVGQQIGGTGNMVIQNNSLDPQLVNTLLDRISARDRELGNHEAAPKEKDQLLAEKDAEIQRLRRQGVQSVVDAAGVQDRSSIAKQALASLGTGDIDAAQSLLRSLEETAAQRANPHRLEAAQLAREQGALWLGRDVEKAYAAFERANNYAAGHLPTLGYLVQLAMQYKGLNVAWQWAQIALRFSEKLAASDPKNSDWQTDLVASAWRLSGLIHDTASQRAAAVLLRNALQILARLKAAGALRADQQSWSQMIQQRLDSWR